MKSETLTFIGLAFALAQVGRGQSIVSIDPIGFEDDGLAGVIAGTGTDGTTYILTGTQFGSDITMTLVEDGFHVSETANIPTGTDTLRVGIKCEVGSDSAVCTEVINVGDVTTSTVISAGNEPTAVEVGSGAAPQPLPSQTTITSLPPSGTGSTTGSLNSTVSMLPPVVSSSQSSLTSSPQLPTSVVGTGTPSAASNSLPLNPTTTASGAESNRKLHVGMLSVLLLAVYVL